MALFRERTPVSPDVCTSLYQHVVTLSRRPVFYRDLEVPDTLDGRFDMLCLHMFLLMNRLKAEATDESAELSQALFDMMFTDMDGVLRQIGVSDLKVGKEVKAMAKAFLGRVEAYDKVIEGDRAGLEDALQRNVYRSETKIVAAPYVADYMHAARTALMKQPWQELSQGRMTLPEPSGF